MSFQKLNLSDRKRSGGRNVVFFYGFGHQDIGNLEDAVKKSGIDDWIVIDEQRKTLIIEDIIDIVHNNQEVVFDIQANKVILFHGTSQYELQQFVANAKSTMSAKPYIAVVTPTSKKWVFKDLLEELIAERKSLSE